ncbi:class I SAM-dependent methyltransferase, partial [Mycobacteroides abscessus]|uniref:class I SAM-dependent methyltransferase n=1 Tax=Mycobacteroides abscessus TaxID=36809 RepID=UPI003CEA79E9
RWPNASVLGLDSSAELLATAPADLPANVRLEQGDIADFHADGVDVVFTNAALQWLPQHRDLISAWAHQLNPGGWLAFQVPGNFGAPSPTMSRRVV